MELRKWTGRAAMGAGGMLALSLLWGRVRAADAPTISPTHLLPSIRTAAAVGGEVSDASRVKAYRSAAALGIGQGMRSGAPDARPVSPGSPRRLVPQGFPRKIVRNASAVFEVKDYEVARRKALDIAVRYGAEASRDDGDESDGHRSGVLAFRVEPEKLEALLRELEPLGRVLSRSLSMETMTEEYVDLVSRVEAARKVEKRLSTLLAVNTDNLEHVLQVERELQRVGTEIETMQGRMKYIDSLAAESTLTLNLAEPSRETSQVHGVAGRTLDSLLRAVNTFVNTGLTLLDLSGFLLAIGLWAGPLAWALRWLYRRLP